MAANSRIDVGEVCLDLAHASSWTCRESRVESTGLTCSFHLRLGRGRRGGTLPEPRWICQSGRRGTRAALVGCLPGSHGAGEVSGREALDGRTDILAPSFLLSIPRPIPFLPPHQTVGITQRRHALSIRDGSSSSSSSSSTSISSPRRRVARLQMGTTGRGQASWAAMASAKEEDGGQYTSWRYDESIIDEAEMGRVGSVANRDESWQTAIAASKGYNWVLPLWVGGRCRGGCLVSI